jgi:hypothetical protein
MLDSTITFSKHNRMKHLIKKSYVAVDAAYETLNIERTDKKDNDQAQARAAIGVALCEFLSHTNACKPIGRDRSTVSIYVRNHDENMKFWKGYAEKYIVATEVCDIHMRGASNKYTVSMINRRIKQYKKKIEQLELEKLKLL